MTTEKITVILYNYNYAGFLKCAVESVLSQTHRNIELIVSDNGSTDDSTAILKQYESDPRVKLMFHKKNSLMGWRFNEPLALASGSFVAFLYADDYFLPRRLEKHLACFSRLSGDYGVVYSPVIRHNIVTGQKWTEASISDSGNILPALLLKSHRDGGLGPAGTLIRRQCLWPYAYFPDGLFEGEGIYMRLALKHQFHYDPEPLAVMREHHSNLGKALELNKEVSLATIRRLESDPDLPAAARSMVDVYCARQMRSYGWRGIRQLENGAWARQCLWEAVKRRPAQLLHPKVAAGWLLSWAPKAWLARFNALLAKLMKHKNNIELIYNPGKMEPMK